MTWRRRHPPKRAYPLPRRGVASGYRRSARSSLSAGRPHLGAAFVGCPPNLDMHAACGMACRSVTYRTAVACRDQPERTALSIAWRGAAAGRWLRHSGGAGNTGRPS